MDFERWHYTKGSEALWLSGPAECHISAASSCIVDLEKEKRSQTHHLVLYFFCSSTTAPAGAPIAITFVNTIIHQLAGHLPLLKGRVTTGFLGNLLEIILRDEPVSDPKGSRFKTNDSVAATIEKILKASSSGYWGALREVLDSEWDKELSLIIDGLDKVWHQKEFIQELCAFVEHLRERPSTTRVLLTSRTQAGVKGLLGQLPSIEYDKERKGWIFLFLILKTGKEAKNCRMSK